MLWDLARENENITLAGILTNQDSKRGRHGALVPTDVSSAALLLEGAGKTIIQLKPERLNTQARKDAAELAPDLLVSFAYGRIFGPRFLSLFPLGGINIHPSLLPKYRGASPIPAVILGREKETGVCIQKLAPEMDSGDILAEDRFDLSPRETSASLSEIVGARAAALLKDLLLRFDHRVGRPQEGQPTYCGEIKKEEGLIDWTKSAQDIDAKIRAYTPWPLSFTNLGEDKLFILEAEPLESTSQAVPGTVLGAERGIRIQTGSGILSVSKLQWQTKKALDWKAFINGFRDFSGKLLG